MTCCWLGLKGVVWSLGQLLVSSGIIISCMVGRRGRFRLEICRAGTGSSPCSDDTTLAVSVAAKIRLVHFPCPVERSTRLGKTLTLLVFHTINLPVCMDQSNSNMVSLIRQDLNWRMIRAENHDFLLHLRMLHTTRQSMAKVVA